MNKRRENDIRYAVEKRIQKERESAEKGDEFKEHIIQCLHYGNVFGVKSPLLTKYIGCIDIWRCVTKLDSRCTSTDRLSIAFEENNVNGDLVRGGIFFDRKGRIYWVQGAYRRFYIFRIVDLREYYHRNKDSIDFKTHIYPEPPEPPSVRAFYLSFPEAYELCVEMCILPENIDEQIVLVKKNR